MRTDRSFTMCTRIRTYSPFFMYKDRQLLPDILHNIATTCLSLYISFIYSPFLFISKLFPFLPPSLPLCLSADLGI